MGRIIGMFMFLFTWFVGIVIFDRLLHYKGSWSMLCGAITWQIAEFMQRKTEGYFAHRD